MLYDSAAQMLFDSAARCYMICFVYVLNGNATYMYVLYDNAG